MTGSPGRTTRGVPVRYLPYTVVKCGFLLVSAKSGRNRGLFLITVVNPWSPMSVARRTPFGILLIITLLGFVASVPVGIGRPDEARASPSPHLMPPNGPSTTGSDGVDQDGSWSTPAHPPWYMATPVPLRAVHTSVHLGTPYLGGVPVLHTSLPYTTVPRPAHASPFGTQRHGQLAIPPCVNLLYVNGSEHLPYSYGPNTKRIAIGTRRSPPTAGPSYTVTVRT